MTTNDGRIKKGEHRSTDTQFKKGHKPTNFIGKWKDGDGYIHIYCPDHPFCDNKGTVREHRLVMEKHLGRYLTPEEVVHHKESFPKDDNRIEGLKLCSHQAEHLLLDHPRQKECNTNTHRMCQKCRDIKELNELNFCKSKKDMYGFGYMCRPCNLIVGRERYAKHKNKPPT